ncbi:hypothetical protein P280DRAFT_492659 [Massarina eburnea CBS 473.64]|uniref:Mitochondrial glycine transporter n=1 Tax=Massarina eburnea CBS 473.64 TaxID=1395130 RepID=A0A6A6RSL8_9PLEO|nr:hypothetical protein P280DRAFT_492659 [Massarina eburnea CBS 473.64]
MDAYPPEYVLHSLPFIVLSGLGARPELDPSRPVDRVLPGRAVANVSSDAPTVADARAGQLLEDFLVLGNRTGFRIRAVGRNYQLPPKKADVPTNSETTTPPNSPSIGAPASWILHSPVSPLSPQSPVFPDGVMAPSWVAKHQDYVPSIFIAFFEFTTDPITNSLHDNQLKAEINKIKVQLQRSEYRTRFAVVLLSSKSILDSPEIDERLNTIRRGTALDPKSQMFFVPPTSPAELRSFVSSLFTTLRPISVEYYRDLTKHSRRKKGRSSIPPPTAPPTRGTSQTLSQPGWNIRYEFKLGVFAEFRQEMDAAQRHYSIALEALFGPDGIFETTASWSPRWDEIRLLSDAIAIRHIRCQLMANCTTSAAQTWLRYKTRLRDVLDRRGKGTSNYGWEAWESTWAKAMAQLIQQTDLKVFRITDPLPETERLPAVETNLLFAPPEALFPEGERLPPWELLHHAGYWYKSAADHAKRRYLLSRDMPEEDRTPPGMSPATKVSNRNQIYDNYLVPEPHLEYPMPGFTGGFEHWKDIVGKLSAAVAEYDARDQSRRVEQLQLEMARTLLHVKRFDDAFKVLKPLWETMSWRREGWWTLSSEVLWGLHECALRVSDAETYAATEFELCSRYSFPQVESEKPSITLNSKDFISCCKLPRLSIVFTFAKGEGNVGEPMPSQITITSTARPGSAPITLSSLAFQFKGGLSKVRLEHEAGESTSESQYYECSFEEHLASPSSPPGEKPQWAGHGDLEIHPGQTKAYTFPITFREAGEVEAITSSFEIQTDRFTLASSADDLHLQPETMAIWWQKAGSTARPKKLNRTNGIAIKVLPKPPKMEIRLPSVRDNYYTDEPIILAMEIWNKEEEDTEAVVEVRLLGRSKDTLAYEWISDATSPMKEVPPPVDGDMDLPGHVVGNISKGERTVEKIRFNAPAEPADYAIEVKVLYHLLSDRDIPISKTLIADLVFISPFETSYELTPRVHPDAWPSYFEVQEAEAAQHPESTDCFGISQKWHLKAKIASFADDLLVMKELAVEIQGVHGGATCELSREFEETNITMEPQKIHGWSFCIDVRKSNLEERRPTGIDSSLNILWQRSDDATNTTVMTNIPIPRIHIPSSEPRDLVYMDYMLENPTMHFLAFELSMEASEQFGFSGTKQTVRYSIIPLSTAVGMWVTPQLRVTDRYFNKTLKVQATDGLRLDKKGVIHFFAGLSSGMLSAVLLQPADLLKTRVQQSHQNTLLGTIKAIASGPQPIRQFWRGTLPSTLRTGIGSAIYFSGLNALRRRAELATQRASEHSGKGDGHSSTLPKLSNTANLATGAFARTWAGFVMMPITVLKVRYESNLYAYSSMFSASKDIFRTEGMRGFFRGFGATAVRDAPYAGLYVLFYEQSKRRLSRLATTIEERASTPVPVLSSSTSAGINFSSGVAAAGLATTVTNPFDAIKTRIQLMPDRYTNTVQAAKKMLVEDGARSFFGGLGIRIARKAVSSALAWTVYEELLRRAESRWHETVEEKV